MQFFSESTPFTFNYVTFDRASGLNVAANIYDVSTGTPVFVSQVPMIETSVNSGNYFGTFAGQIMKSYLVVAAVFTDNTYSTLVTTRAPNADTYKNSNAPQSFGVFSFGAWNQNASLFVAANIYDVTTGRSVFVSQVPMNHVFAGIYFGDFSGNASDTYQIAMNVYQDSGYTTLDTGYAPGSDQYQLDANVITTILQGSPSLKGTLNTATLVESA